MNNQGTITIHNFIADYTDHTGQHYNRCFQMMDMLATDEAQAANTLQEHLANNGMLVYCLMCIREKLSMEELQHVADSGELPDVKQGHMCIYPGPQFMADMKLSANHKYRGYPVNQRGFANGQKG